VKEINLFKVKKIYRQESSVYRIFLETNSPSPRLKHLSTNPQERTSSFCHDKIPPDWRQSVANFAHQQKLTIRTLPPILNSSSSISSSKYTKNHQLNIPQNNQRSMSLSSIVLNYSKSSLLRYHPPLLTEQKSNHRRALSYEELFSSNKINSNLSISRQDDSVNASGCSLAMDIDRKNSPSSSSSSSSSSTINTDDENDDKQESIKIDKKIKQFKWKLRINK
jgi:hypothetical protein